MPSCNKEVKGLAGWSSWVARLAHNQKVVGSSPTPATNKENIMKLAFSFIEGSNVVMAYSYFNKKVRLVTKATMYHGRILN